MSFGHVFVIHGTIGHLVADATVVPTDNRFSVRDYWWHTLGSDNQSGVQHHRSDQWAERGWGRSATGAPVWFLDVTAGVTAGVDRFGRLESVLADITAQRHDARTGRVKPLIVLPVIGTQGGGFTHQRGQVVRQLLQMCASHVQHNDVDIAILTQTPSVYAALQHVRRSEAAQYLPFGNDLLVSELADRARSGSLALFIGAGASVPAGAPTWDQLIETLAVEADFSTEIAHDISALSALDKAELIKRHLAPGRLAELIDRSLTGAAQPALTHALLAALKVDAAVTTNYDHLYEQAVSASGEQAFSVLPAEVPLARGRWILKMHGDVKYPESIVLTRGDFVDIAASAASGAVLQSLLLTKHLLIVGASLTDDNVLRLIHQVSGYRQLHRKIEDVQDVFGTVLDVDANTARKELHSAHFKWWTAWGNDVKQRGRQLEIFLDCVAARAAQDYSWLLDPDFDDLHDPEHRRLVGDLRNLYDRIPRTYDDVHPWNALRDSFHRFGIQQEK